MRARTRKLFAAIGLLAGWFVTEAAAQQAPPSTTPVPMPPPVQPAPAPAILGQPEPATAPPALPPAYAPAVPPPVITPAPISPLSPPPPPGPAPLFGLPDPGRDGWADLGLPTKLSGLFVDTELDIVVPSVRNRLSGTVTFPNGSTNVVSVPQSNLDWTVAPRFDVGYRLPDGQGEFSVGYRFLVSDGRDEQLASFGESSIKSRLDINQIDLDYATATYSPLPRYDLKFRIGARMAAVYLDSQAVDAFNYQQASSYYLGAGPHAAIDFEYHFRELSELGLFFRGDVAAMTGEEQQKFRETLGDSLSDEESAFFTQRRTQTIPTLTLQVGFVYHPLGIANDHLRFAGGYQFEEWWGVGKIENSDADVNVQGIFLRAEYDF